MKASKCDICGKFSDKREGNVTCLGTCLGERSVDLCEKHWEEFLEFWKKFTIKKFTHIEPIYYVCSGDNDQQSDDWGKPDGETMATSTWGGAGPDCKTMQE